MARIRKSSRASDHARRDRSRDISNPGNLLTRNSSSTDSVSFHPSPPILAISAIQTARVIVALPAQTGFYRDQDRPSASVTLALQPGHVLDRNQIAAIVHTTARSVPGLAAKDVSLRRSASGWVGSQRWPACNLRSPRRLAPGR